MYKKFISDNENLKEVFKNLEKISQKRNLQHTFNDFVNICFITLHNKNRNVLV